ncbi:MAG: ShlB/FhaC/HecB family hemolysin secretion/activation protein [Candidatus Omnitrophica bacterium]|nr:ShlB/FhaC/HecB family hemolysin secretion/activation protein [Candidatus Omnitrophota bacterium]
MKNTKNYFLVLFLFISTSTFASPPLVPAKDSAGGVQAGTALQENDLKLRKNIQEKRAPVEIDQARQEEISKLPDSQKVLVTKIEVTGAKLLSAKDINAIIKPFENKTLTIREMQDVANRITDAYRQKGYITSRAILPPQKVENSILKIEVIEGKMGDITVQGNKYYSTSLIKRKIDLKPGVPFDYTKLQNNLSIINQYQDRKVKTVLKPGQAPATTDLVLDVKDNLPIHVGLSYDNYGSRYLRHFRYQGTVTDNNLLGFDDIMTLTYQTAEGHNTYRLNSLRYLFPLSNTTQLGFYAGKTQLRLGKEFEDLNARGKSDLYSIYLTHALLKNDTTDLTLSEAFDYQDVYNFELGQETSRDRLRVARVGLKLDKSDNFNGRTIINNEIQQGIPHQWGSLKSKDPTASRANISGGLFTKDVLDVLRLQNLPLDSTLLLKGQGQLASHALTASEQFQIGGISNVRGYPSGEVVGDDGISLTGEWSFPVYFIPKNIDAPFSKAKLYDALHLAAFYDWAEAYLRVPAGEKKDKKLSSLGCGLRYDLPENFSARLDVAWPLDQLPSDGNHMHAWVKISKDF